LVWFQTGFESKRHKDQETAQKRLERANTPAQTCNSGAAQRLWREMDAIPRQNPRHEQIALSLRKFEEALCVLHGLSLSWGLKRGIKLSGRGAFAEKNEPAGREHPAGCTELHLLGGGTHAKLCFFSAQRLGILVDFDFAMIIDMVAVNIVEMTIMDVVHVIAVADHHVLVCVAVHVVSVCGFIHWGFSGRVFSGDFQHMLVHVIAVNAVQVAIVQIVPMVIVADFDVTAIVAVNMGVGFMNVGCVGGCCFCWGNGASACEAKNSAA
jgi:hypothetical protein